MKITKVEAIPVRQPGEIQKINDSAQDGVIIKVYTDAPVIIGLKTLRLKKCWKLSAF